MLLEANNVTKRFGSKLAVQGVTLNLERGKVYGILGPNGSGKTTFMKLVAGLLHPDLGEITVDGHKIGPKSKEIVSYMSTENYIYEFMKLNTVGQYFSDLFVDFDIETYTRIIKKLDLTEELKVGNLSTGQRNRVKLAVALARKCQLIMLDEPLNGIDLVSREKIIQCIISEIRPEQALLISSHLVSEIETILDDVIFIQEGNVILNAESEAVRTEQEKSVTEYYKEVYGA